MSCQVSSSSQNDDWTNKAIRQNSSGLSAIAEFNASLGCQQGMNDGNLQFDQSSDVFDFQHNPLEPSSFGTQHHQSSNPGSPYYIPSIETTNIQFPTYPSHLQNVHRRSISEPPMDSNHDLYSIAPPPTHAQQSGITFHRGGHYLGHPQQARPLKSLPKGRNSARSQPYKMKGKEVSQGQYGSPRYHPRSNMSRPPTSAPMMYEAGMQLGSSTQYQTTRVCTPDPADVIDPLLSTQQAAAKVTLPVTMEELRAMIEAAVQKAVQASRQEPEPPIEATSEPVENTI